MRKAIIICTALILSCRSSQEHVPELFAHPGEKINTVSDKPSLPFPEAPTIRLSSIPRDISSGIDNRTITLRLDSGGAVLLDTVVQSILSAVELRTFPGLATVPVIATSAPPGSDSMAPRNITVIPTNPLANGWYVVSIARLPPGVAPFVDSAPETSGVTGALSRFAIGAAPVLRDVRITSSGKVILDFSEDMVVEPTNVASLVSVTSVDDSACALLPTNFPSPSSQIGFQCSSATWLAQRIRLSIAPGALEREWSPTGPSAREGLCCVFSRSNIRARDQFFYFDRMLKQLQTGERSCRKRHDPAQPHHPCNSDLSLAAQS